MRKWSCLLVVGALLFSGCGGSEGKASSAKSSEAPETSPSSEPSESSTPSEPAEVSGLAGTFLHEGRYKTDLFKPGFAFKAPDLPYPFTADVDTEDYVMLTKAPGFQAVIFAKPGKMYASDNVTLEKTPSDILSWFESNSYLTTKRGPSLQIGSASGESIDVRVKELADDQPKFDCGKCIALFEVDGFGPLGISKGDVIRVAQVKVAGEGILVLLFTPKSDFRQFMSVGAGVLESVEWKK